MLLVGMAVSAVVFGLAAALQRSEADPGGARRGADDDGSELRRALEAGAAKFEADRVVAARVRFLDAEPISRSSAEPARRLVATALGTAGFSMQDILLEPYGGKILHLPVGVTTALTAMLALGGGAGLVLAARLLAARQTPIASRASARL